MQASSNAQLQEAKNCVIDEQLPDAVNFQHLKSTGVTLLQKSVGEVWSNYNDSDPGVTILDQLCYGLIELGYCNQFPIVDVLTRADGKIHYHNQFFEPQDILTTAPITADDYCRLVLDQIAAVRLIEIVPEQIANSGASETDAGSMVTGRYQPYVCLSQSNAAQSDANSANDANNASNAILRQVYVLLNQQRNLAEVFLMPKLFTSQSITLEGTVVLTATADASQVETQLTEVLQNYAAPLSQRSGYLELRMQGQGADQVFNGPLMQEGWMCGANALGQKCATVSLFQLSSLIAGINGVQYVESLSFSADSLPANATNTVEIAIADSAIAVIQLGASFSLQQNHATLAMGSASTKSGLYFGALQSSHRANSIEAKAELYPAQLHGKYRDIESYYSVQNTFPDQYNIGPNSLHSDAPSYKVARSRQLKGYLMPFDQLLANQFSQLAHVADLFSFQPSKVFAYKPPTATLKQQQWKYKQVPVGFAGMPIRRFSTTYFCQPLYDIPNVRPLLAGNALFAYQFGEQVQGREQGSEQAAAQPNTANNANNKSVSQKQQAQAQWQAFINFPFNQYMYGMLQGMESEREANARRERMLDHLMARHGCDASLYHEMIKACQWIGNESKTRIIAKTSWLQNFQRLSYHRCRAFDALAPALLPQPESLFALPLPNSYPEMDGEPDQARLYASAKVRKSDFARYSAFELVAGIWLDLPRYYLNLVGKLISLLQNKDFVKWLQDAVVPNAAPRTTFCLPNSDLRVVPGTAPPSTDNSNADNAEGTGSTQSAAKDQLFDGQQCLMDIVWTNGTIPSVADYQAHAAQLRWLATQRKGMLLIEPVLLLPASATLERSVQAYLLTAFLMLPNYVSLIQQPAFAQYVKTLQDLHWPAHVTLQYSPTSFNVLKAVIWTYVWWNNSLHKSAQDSGNLSASANRSSASKNASNNASNKSANQAKAKDFPALMAKLLKLPALPTSPVAPSPSATQDGQHA